jgi:hypothetical protein
MNVVDYFGVSIIMLDEAEAASGDWRHAAGEAEVARVERPDPACWSTLRAQGFLPKPQQITWLTDVGESEDAYLAGLTSGERQKIRVARRTMADEGLAVDVRDLDAPLFDAFLPVYEASLARMRHGVSVAAAEREEILADRDRYFAVCVADGPALIGCALVRREPDRDTVRVRFSAVDLAHREASMSRVLYLEAARVARAFGHRVFSLGKDRNLYGHIAQPGLLRFKRQLGFRPHPSHHIDATTGHDQADLILRTGVELADPTMLLSYLNDKPDEHLRLEVFTRRAEVDLRPFAAKFPDGMRVHASDWEVADA